MTLIVILLLCFICKGLHYTFVCSRIVSMSEVLTFIALFCVVGSWKGVDAWKEDICLTNDCYSIVFLWCTVCFVICIWL